MRYIYSLIGFFLLSGCAAVETSSQTCASQEWEWTRYRAQIESKRGVKWTEFSEIERRKILDYVNSAQPKTGYAYNRAGYFTGQGHSVALVVFLMGDCVWESHMTTRGVLRQMIGQES